MQAVRAHSAQAPRVQHDDVTARHADSDVATVAADLHYSCGFVVNFDTFDKRCLRVVLGLFVAVGNTPCCQFRRFATRKLKSEKQTVRVKSAKK